MLEKKSKIRQNRMNTFNSVLIYFCTLIVHNLNFLLNLTIKQLHKNCRSYKIASWWLRAFLVPIAHRVKNDCH